MDDQSKPPVVVKVDRVSKNFALPHEQANSTKMLFTHIFNSRAFRRTEVQHALKDVSFEVRKGEFFGVVGRNGSGKSTLLKMMAGIYQPTSGSITTTGKLVPFIELGVGFNGELTGRENVFLNGALLGFSRKQTESHYKEIVEFAELEKFMDQKLKNYSSGMKVRLAFACATMSQADILVVDEVLAVGDADFQRKCFDYFKQIKRGDTTVIFVSHDMNAIKEFCDRAVLIEKSKLEYEGDPKDIAREYAMLFMENYKGFVGQGDNKRWGNGDAVVKDVTLTQHGDEIIVSADVLARKNLDSIIYGIHVFSADGRELTAMNNRMINLPDISDIKAKSRFKITWKMLNIFNDGNYSMTLVLGDSANNILDWYNEAATFTIKRAERSTTPIMPPVSAKVTKKEATAAKSH
ncbi:MAG TPA: ABC transporter ATP-binding protein [Candidatus Saccharimonadales bacterium]|nr:ABC transporter ATP-binding protein [Candidatus Saccharimonadales bacterium]